MAHPLQTPWSLWYDSKKTGHGDKYEESLIHVAPFATVEEFWTLFHHIKKPSAIDIGANMHLFRTGIKPMWEDPSNQKGGKWTITLQGPDLARVDTVWENLILGVIGETMDSGDEIVGIVLGKRRSQMKLAIWTRSKEKPEVLMALGKRIRADLEMDPSVAVEFFPHKDPHDAEFPSAMFKV